MIGLIKGLPRKVNMAGSPQPIVTFTSNVKGLDIPEILAYFSATQSGTGDPSPSNPRPISGVSAVNVSAVKQLFNGTLEQGSFSTGTGEKIPSTTRVRSVDDIPLPSGSYVLNNLNGWQFVLYVYDLEGNFKSSESYISWRNNPLSFNLVADRKINFGIRNDTNTTIVPSDVVGLTLYDSTVGQTVTINLGGTYYGGYLNVPTGLLTVTHGYEKLDPQETWVYSSSWSKTNTNVFYMLNVNQNIHYSSYDDEAVKLCNLMPTGSRNQIYNADDNIVGVSGAVGTPQITVRILKSLCADTSAFLNFITNNDVYICYELATPQTYQLTPAQIEQLLGQNNVFCSSGDVAVTQIWARRERSIISRG